MAGKLTGKVAGNVTGRMAGNVPGRMAGNVPGRMASNGLGGWQSDWQGGWQGSWGNQILQPVYVCVCVWDKKCQLSSWVGGCCVPATFCSDTTHHTHTHILSPHTHILSPHTHTHTLTTHNCGINQLPPFKQYLKHINIFHRCASWK